MKILVTGGAGYIGSILVPALLAEGHMVTVLDNLMYKQTSLLEHCYNPKFEFLKGDVRDAALLKEMVPQFDVLLPLAAIVGAPACEKDPLLATSVNLDAVVELNKIRSKNQWVLYPTTNSGYGVGEESAYCTEGTPLRPISLYGRTKVQAEKVLLDGENVITFRLATVFGLSPRMRLDLMVNDFTYRALKDRFIVLFEENFKRNYLHIRDVASVFVFAVENFEKMKNQPYNVGLSSANLSKRELCEKIKDHIPQFAIYSSSLGKDPDQRNYIVSNEKIEKTGWAPKIDLDDGIEELIKGYRILNATGFTNL
jgi:nucleoside-diphosphate-sugar epimerase